MKKNLRLSVKSVSDVSIRCLTKELLAIRVCVYASILGQKIDKKLENNPFPILYRNIGSVFVTLDEW